MSLYGLQASFAIEYEPAKSWPYIHTRLWLGGSWIGDMSDSIMPEQMCIKLITLHNAIADSKYVYESLSECPKESDLRDRGGWSFGESFDPFSMIYYVILGDSLAHFSWKLSEPYYSMFPTYPKSSRQFSVSLDQYRTPTYQFIMSMILSGYYTPGYDNPNIK